jgi:hypothetical protein
MLPPLDVESTTGSRHTGQGTRAQLEAALALCRRLGERLYATHIEHALDGLERR